MRIYRLLLYAVILAACAGSSAIGAQTIPDWALKDLGPSVLSSRFVVGQMRPQYVSFDTLAGAGTPKEVAGRMCAGPREQFLPDRSAMDARGVAHHRFRQYYLGHRVVGSRLVVNQRGEKVTSLHGEVYDRFASPPVDRFEVTGAELVWVPPGLQFGKPFELAYRVDIRDPESLIYERQYLSAATGELIAREDRLAATDTPGKARTALSGERPIVAEFRTDGTYRLHEEARKITTLNLRRSRITVNAVDFTDEDNYWNNANPERDEVATDVHWAMGKYHDLLDSMGRNSIDNAGHPLRAYVHFGEQQANARWNGRVALFGDGDTTTILDLPLVSPDIVGHEFTHGLIDFTAGLLYVGESGALNEGYCDIFGYRTSHYARGAANTPWKIAKESTSNGAGLRDFAAPNASFQPDTYGGELWRDTTAIHINNGVLNHWFYLLTNGGDGVNDHGTAYSLAGLGVDTAFSVAYRTLTVYLSETSDYADAAFYSLRAATDLYGECTVAYRQVNDAWAAVGVGEALVRPVAGFEVVDTVVEFGEPVVVTPAANIVGSVAAYDPGDGSSLIESPAFEYTYAQSGSYTISQRVSNCAGVDTFFANVTVHPAPRLAVRGDTLLLRGVNGRATSATLTLANAGGGRLRWRVAAVPEGMVVTPGSGEIVGGDSLGVAVAYTSAETTLIDTTSQIQIAVSGVTDTTISVVTRLTVHPQPRVGFALTADTTCKTRIHCANHTEFADEYFWRFSETDTSTLAEPTYDFEEPGEYRISLRASRSGYHDTLDILLTIDEPSFPLGIDVPDMVLSGEPVILQANAPPGVTSFEWRLGDSILAPVAAPQVVFADTGTVELTLQGAYEDGCSRTVFKELFVGPEMTTSVLTDDREVRIELFPNPASGHVTLSLTGRTARRSIDLELYNAGGLLVWSKAAAVGPGRSEATIPVGALPGGVYWVRGSMRHGAAFIRRLLIR